MAKRKDRRPNVPEATLARARAELAGESVPTAAAKNPTVKSRPTTPQKPQPTKPAVTVEDLKAEYVYVISDLRSMGILAGVLFVALVIAAQIFV